jgi:hypothetical protein
MSEKKPDSVVYSDSKGYYASTLEYATNVGAPSIIPLDNTSWKQDGIVKVNHHLGSRFEELKTQYLKLVEEYKWNELVYNAEFKWEPVIGETYHLYEGRGQRFLSLIGPNEWGKDMGFIGSFRLSSTKVWEKI